MTGTKVVSVARLADWLRSLLRPRLAVFATQATSHGTLVTRVAIRLTTVTERAIRTTLALCGVALVGFGPVLRPEFGSAAVTVGSLAVVFAARTLGKTTTMVDAPLARAAVRAALTEGREHAARHWRIEGSAAVEVGRELERLQSLWLTGYAAESGELDRARATMLANAASPRLSPYLGELSVAEHQAWLAIPASGRLTQEEPGLSAEYHRDGADWPSRNQLESGPTWPTLDGHDHP